MPGLSVKRARRLGAGESLVAAKSAAAWCGFALSGGVADSEGSSSVRRSPSPRFVVKRAGVWPCAVPPQHPPAAGCRECAPAEVCKPRLCRPLPLGKDRQDAWAFREVRSRTTCRCRHGSGSRIRIRTVGPSRRGIRSRCGKVFHYFAPSTPSRSGRKRCHPSQVPDETCH